ncbi:hypothetical protein [Catenulispora subtropica]|uniref:Uncharacterized protein n=1 Tax=Catenulispora subtropica TaxID=450798 RepID=A0ABP5EMJ0_9ACTN
MSTDQEWARDLFERSRQAEEPMWVADHAAMMQAGRRRNRIRAVTASGSAVAVVAVAAAVGIGVLGGGGPKSRAPQPAPGAAPTTTRSVAAVAPDPTTVLAYARFENWSTKDNKAQDPDYFKKYFIAVPDATARDTMVLLTRLDPALSHIAKVRSPAPSEGVRLVPDNDPMADDMAQLSGDVLWSDGGEPETALRNLTSKTPYGTLDLRFVATADVTPGDPKGGACWPRQVAGTGMLKPVAIAGGGWSEGAKWSDCNVATLSDGSVLQSATKSSGPFSVVYAVRRFPGDAGAVEATWWNYASTMEFQSGNGPDPKRVVSPNPIAEDKLRKALSDPGIKAPLTATPTAGPPSDMPQAADFGSGWTFDAEQSHSTTGALVVDDGCTNEQNMVATPKPSYAYAGTTPSGIAVTASAGLNVMKPGTGAHWMAELRQHGTGGCDQGTLKYSQDTMTALPGGIGDDAFIENWVGQDSETIFVRFGDAVLRLDVTTADHSMPKFTAQDKAWFAGLAAKVAARHHG